jgi:hypothetical protein
MLVHEPDAIAGRIDDAFVGPKDAERNVRERGFARTVLADQRMYFMRVEIQVDAVDRAHARKTLSNAA